MGVSSNATVRCIMALSDTLSNSSIGTAATRWRNCSRSISDAAMTAEKAVDYAIAAAEKAQRRWANSDALTYFDDALRRLDTMPETEANRLRHIDAVLKQAEVKFALGQQAEHLAALENIRSIVEADRRPSPHALRGTTGPGFCTA